MRSAITYVVFAGAFAASLTGANAAAQIAVSANDGKVMLVDGVNMPRPDPHPDTVTIMAVSVVSPGVIGEVRAPIFRGQTAAQCRHFARSIPGAG